MKLLMTKLSRWKAKELFLLIYCLLFMANIGFSSTTPKPPDVSLCPTLCMCNPSIGVVNCSNRGLKEIPPNIPRWVVNLSLRNNKISKDGLSSFIFNAVPLLQELDLSENKIVNFTVDLTATPSLNKIVLDHCSLTEIPEFKHHGSITHLSLSHNSIAELRSSSLSKLPNLTHLDLSYNRIRQLGTDAFLAQTHLTHLFLQRNKVTNLDWDSFAGLHSIDTIDLSRNRIRNIAKSSTPPQPISKQQICVGNLKSLKHIDLSRNQLSHINGLAFSGMCNLATLQLQYNRINKLSDGAFYGPQSLKSLILDHNNINAVSRGWLFELSSLQTLSVAYNNVSKIESNGWDFCKELVYLNLSHNLLPSLAAYGFSQLTKLLTLHLNHNKISVIEDNAFHGLTVLEKLDLSFNEISSSIEDINGAFIGLTYIEELSLRRNKIRSLSASVLEGLENINSLDLRENNITSIQNHTFDNMDSLHSLQIISSSFLCDCQLAWFPAWLEQMNQTRRGFVSTVSGSCFHPPALLGRDILSIANSEFVCGDHPIPVLLQQPTSLSALRGDNVTLECSASAHLAESVNRTTPAPTPVSGDSPTRNNPSRESFLSLQAEDVADKKENKDKMMITWKMGQEVIHPGGNVRIQNQTRHEAGYVYFTSTLLLSGVTSADVGSYGCIISNKYGDDRSKPVYLEVNEYPKFTKTPANVTVVRNGSEAILACAATGQPSPQITWQKDGGKDFPAAGDRRLLREQTKFRKISDTRDAKGTSPTKGGFKNPLLGSSPDKDSNSDNSEEIFMVDTDAPLHIGVVLPEDGGEYECVVQSSVGRIVAKAILIVEITPVFSKAMEPASKAVYGKNAVISCVVEGNPPPQMSWYFNGERLNVTSRHLLAGDDQVLVITETNYSDSGIYTCEATNHLGTISGKTELEVYEKASYSESEDNFLTVLFGDNSTTGIVIIIVFACVVFTSLVWLIILCYTRKNPEQALSTNTDETDVPQMDVHSYVSTDESIRKAQSNHSIHSMDNETVVQGRSKNKESIGVQYRTSASASDIHLMQINHNYPRPRNASESSNQIFRSFPRRCQSSMVIKKDNNKPMMPRFHSTDNFRLGESLLPPRTPSKSQKRVKVATPQRPLVSPSSNFAKKAATQETYVPVYLKNREKTRIRNGSAIVRESASSSTADTIDSRNRSKKLKKVKDHNQRKLKQNEQHESDSITKEGNAMKNGGSHCIANGVLPREGGQNWGRNGCPRGMITPEQMYIHQPVNQRQHDESAETDRTKNAMSWRNYNHRDRRKNERDVRDALHSDTRTDFTSTHEMSPCRRPAEISSDSCEPAVFSSENTLVSESSALLSSESISAKSVSVTPSSGQEYEHLLTSSA